MLNKDFNGMTTTSGGKIECLKAVMINRDDTFTQVENILIIVNKIDYRQNMNIEICDALLSHKKN